MDTMVCKRPATLFSFSADDGVYKTKSRNMSSLVSQLDLSDHQITSTEPDNVAGLSQTVSETCKLSLAKFNEPIKMRPISVQAI